VLPDFLLEGFLASSVCPGENDEEIKMSTVDWWLMLKGKPKYLKKNLSQPLFVHHKSHMD
jgi:hypothetical protein